MKCSLCGIELEAGDLSQDDIDITQKKAANEVKAVCENCIEMPGNSPPDITKEVWVIFPPKDEQ